MKLIWFSICRHLSTCIHESSTSLMVPVNHQKLSAFPMIRNPVCYLMDCFKTFVTKEHLHEEIKSMQKLVYQSDFLKDYFKNESVKNANPINNEIMDLLTSIDIKCDRTNENLRIVYEILDQW